MEFKSFSMFSILENLNRMTLDDNFQSFNKQE